MAKQVPQSARDSFRDGFFQTERMTQDTAPDISIRLLSGTVQVRKTLEQSYTQLKEAGLDDDICDISQIILAEVLNNVVEHAYSFAEGHPICLSLWLRGDGIWCRIKDYGVAMPNNVPPAGRPAVIPGQDRDTLPEGGFGWAMVHELTEGLRYFREAGENELSFLIPTGGA